MHGRSNWEDVDVSDASFALPARLDVLRTLLRSDGASLYALNAPVRGVTPLGLAAWLNLPDVVRGLLEESRGLVAVDGTDAVGVTPLMCTCSSFFLGWPRAGADVFACCRHRPRWRRRGGFASGADGFFVVGPCSG